jgi:hypothetical protein
MYILITKKYVDDGSKDLRVFKCIYEHIETFSYKDSIAIRIRNYTKETNSRILEPDKKGGIVVYHSETSFTEFKIFQELKASTFYNKYI